MSDSEGTPLLITSDELDKLEKAGVQQIKRIFRKSLVAVALTAVMTATVVNIAWWTACG